MENKGNLREKGRWLKVCIGLLVSIATLFGGGILTSTANATDAKPAPMASGLGLVSGYWFNPVSYGSYFWGAHTAGLGGMMLVNGRPVYCVEVGEPIGPNVGGWTH